jgi:putative transposase
MPRARSTRSATKPGQLRLLGVPQRPKRKATRHGGPREGAGRKPKNGKTAGVSHLQRPKQSRHVPLHITIRLCDGLPSMRRRRGYKLAQRAMALANRFEEARLCHLSIQRNHLHLIIEADDQAALTRAMRSFGVSLAKNVKHELRRPGRMRIFADRYHIEKLTTPAQVRNALAYVLGNWRKHGEDRDIPGPPPRMDRYSVARTSRAGIRGHRRRSSASTRCPSRKTVRYRSGSRRRTCCVRAGNATGSSRRGTGRGRGDADAGVRAPVPACGHDSRKPPRELDPDPVSGRPTTRDESSSCRFPA